MGNTHLKHTKTLKRSAPSLRCLHIWFAPLALAGGCVLGLWPLYCAAGGFDPLVLRAAGNLVLHAAAGALAVGIAPVGKKLLFVCGLAPFALQLACQPAPESLLFPLALLFFAQTLALAFLPVRAGGVRLFFYALSAAALGMLCLRDQIAAAPLLLMAGLIPARRWIPAALLQPPVLPDAGEQRRAVRRAALARGLRFALHLLWAAAAVYLAVRILPDAGTLRALTQLSPDILLETAGSKYAALARLLAAGIYPDAWNTCGELLYTNTLAASEGIWLHTAPVPLLWGLLSCSSLFEPAVRLRPSRRQRCIAIGVSAAAILCALAARLVWAQAIPTALTVLCFAPVLLWALTPDRLVLRRERPGRLAAAAAVLLALTALPFIAMSL